MMSLLRGCDAFCVFLGVFVRDRTSASLEIGIKLDEIGVDSCGIGANMARESAKCSLLGVHVADMDAKQD